MCDLGWISLHRKIKEHWLWKDPIKFQWWMDILLTVNHSDSKINMGNQLIICKRGQSLRSLQTWAGEWKTSKSMVRRFFDLLQSDGMIVTENVQKTTRITVCKYDSYQVLRNDGETKPKRKRNVAGTQPAPNNNGNKDNNENKDIGEQINSFLDECLKHLKPEERQTWDKYSTWFQEQEFKTITKIPEQLTPPQLLKLMEKHGATEIKNTLLAMENYKKSKDYTSVYLTLNNWLTKKTS